MRAYRARKKENNTASNNQAQEQVQEDERLVNSVNRGLKPRYTTDNYITMNRVSDTGDKIVVKVAKGQIFETRYGYGLILDKNHVVWLKDFQVYTSSYGTEVILNKNYFNVKQWGDFSDQFAKNEENYKFETWVNAAKEQEKAGNIVKWSPREDVNYQIRKSVYEAVTRGRRR